MNKKFAVIGASGYIAPRHLQAIRDVGGDLVAALDRHDSVGILDSFFPNTEFFTEFEKFDYFVRSLQSDEKVGTVSICSPNHLHKSHIAFGLCAGANVICEKPLVLNPYDLDELVHLENVTGRCVNTILQLRVHPALVALKREIDAAPADKIFDVDLGYFTSRGKWYHQSWKGEEEKSGGIATNIGVHFFDMLGFLFGKNALSVAHHRSADSAGGYLEFEKARVRWVMSINKDHLPAPTPHGQFTYRSITVDGKEIEFSGGFTDLHTMSYQQVLEGRGFGVETVRPAIELVSNLRTAPLQPRVGERHPLLRSVCK